MILSSPSRESGQECCALGHDHGFTIVTSSLFFSETKKSALAMQRGTVAMQSDQWVLSRSGWWREQWSERKKTLRLIHHSGTQGWEHVQSFLSTEGTKNHYMESEEKTSCSNTIWRKARVLVSTLVCITNTTEHLSIILSHLRGASNSLISIPQTWHLYELISFQLHGFIYNLSFHQIEISSKFMWI